MVQTIDVTGLEPEAIRAVELLVGKLREKATSHGSVVPSIFDLFGKAPTLRNAEEIAKQLQEERDGWGEP